MADKLKITLVRSYHGRLPRHRKTLKALGLTKMHRTVEKPDNPSIRGMTQQVSHLVQVVEE